MPAAQARWRHTLGAGGSAIYLVLILGLTGLLEMFYYIPDPAQAAISVQRITYHVPFGAFTRNLHYWAAQLLLIVGGLHLLRVVFTAAYGGKRRFNYLLGLTLFMLAVLLDFTGYILRWDADVCWPLVTGTNLLRSIPLVGGQLYRLATGGGEACSTALVRFYTWHILGLSIVMLVLMVWHAFRVRRDGGIAAPPPGLRDSGARVSRDVLLRREVLAILALSVVLIVLSTTVPAPIAPAMTNPPGIGAQARAPWFFLWVQQMLKWGDPFAFGVLAPLGLLSVLALVPYLLPEPDAADIGRWFTKSARAAQVVVSFVFLAALILTVFALAGA